MNEGNHNRKQIAVNTHLWLPTVLFAVFCAVSVSCMIEKEVGLCIGFSAAALAALFVFLVSPVYYTFSQEGVVIRYFWGLKEEAAWSTIVSITFSGGWMSRGAGTPH